MTTPPGTTLEVLERRLEFLRRNMNALQFVINLDGALSMYQPTQPPRFLWDPRLGADERTLAGVHEMVHVVLLPPGSTPVGRNETVVEERIAHYVAGRACTYFGVTQYPVDLERWPQQTFDEEAGEREGVDQLLSTLVETLNCPDDLPAWLGRDNHSFGIASLEIAWATDSQ